MKLSKSIFIIFIILFSFVSFSMAQKSSSTINWLSKGAGDYRYCKIDGSNCNFNVSVEVNMSDTNFTHLANLTDVNLSGLQNGDLLQYNTTLNQWQNVRENSIGENFTGLWDNVSGVATYYGNVDIQDNLSVGDEIDSQSLTLTNGMSNQDKEGLNLYYTSGVGGAIFSIDYPGETWESLYIDGAPIYFNQLSSSYSVFNNIQTDNITAVNISATGQICDINGCIGSVQADGNASSICTNGEVLFGSIDGCRDFNSSVQDLIRSVEYNCTNITVPYGTITGGNLSSIQIADDNQWLNITEGSGLPPVLEVIFNFTAIDNFNSVQFDIWYAGGSGHEIQIGIFDCDDSSYEFEYEPNIVDMVAIQRQARNVLDPSGHICGANKDVSVKFSHIDNGNSAHVLRIDDIKLISGAPVSSPTEVDPYSIHKDGSVKWEGNENGSSYNSTNWNLITTDNLTINGENINNKYLEIDGANANQNIDIQGYRLESGSTEQAIIGDDSSNIAGYFTDGLSSVYLSGSSGFALDVRDSPSYFEDGATSVYLAYASKSLLSAYHIDISNSYSARIGDDSSQVSGYFSGNGGLVEIADSKHAIDVNRGDVHLESGTSNVIMNNNNLSLEGELILNSSSGHLMTFNNQESGALESGSITWIGGSRLIEQRSGGTGVDRMVYTPNGNRIDILNEAGSAYGSDIYGGDLFHRGDGRGYRSVYGNGKDVEIYFDGADMIINSNDITASDELLFTNFDIYNFDNTLQIDGTIQNSNGESILFTTDTVEFLVNYGNTMNIGSNSVTFAGNNVRFLETGDVVYFSDWNGSDREDFMRADVQADEIDFIQYDILTTGNITAHSLFLNESSLYLGGNKLSASGSELLWNDAPIESTPTGNVSDVYVNITGDTMTGNLTINTSSAKLKILTDGNSGSAQIELKENSGGDLGFNLAYDGSENELTLDSNGASGKRWLRIHRSLSFINLTQDTSIDGKVSTNDRFYLPNGGSIGDNSTCAFIFYDNLNNVIDTMGCS